MAQKRYRALRVCAKSSGNLSRVKIEVGLGRDTEMMGGLNVVLGRSKIAGVKVQI